MRQVRFTLAFAALASAAASPLLAQGMLDEVVVTAQKREQSLQDTPISIAAFDSEAIERRGISDINDIGASVPNVKMTPSPSNSTATTISIRGSVTINPAITWEPTVGIYLDGVFIGKNLGGVFDVADLERVEVLRGPQGTLYGKNTVGGAVNLITRAPSGEFGGRIVAGAGSYNLRTGFAAIDFPAIEIGEGRLSTKLVGSYKKRDGFYKNVPDPFGNPMANPPSSSELSDMDRQVARFDALWDVSDRLELRYTYDYSDIDQKPVKQQLTFFDPTDMSFGPLPPGFGDYLTGENENRRRTSSDGSQFEQSKSSAHTLTAQYDAGQVAMLGDITLKYIGNTRTLEWNDDIDIDGTPLAVFSSGRYIDYDQHSHEFQIVGATPRTDYVVGVFYFSEEADVFNPIRFFELYGNPPQRNAYGFDNNSVAVFGQVEWRPAAAVFQDRLALTAGLRWTREEKEGYVVRPDDLDPVTFQPTPFAAQRSKTFSNISPTFIAAWDLTDSVNIYGKVATGWKSGGFNGEPPNEADFLRGYDAEEILSYELGMKSRWLGNRVQLNAAVFQNDSKDMQLSIFESGPGALSSVQNAGEARIRGYEVELLVAPIAPLQVGINYGYLDAEYREFIDQGVDMKDQKDFPYTPRHSASSFVEYEVFEESWGRLIAHVDYEYVSSHVPYIEPDQNATSKIDSYGLLNARLTVADIPVARGESLSISLWGRNIRDKEYRVNTIPFGPWTSSFYGDPRTYGVEAKYQF